MTDSAERIWILGSDRELVIRTHALSHPRCVIRDLVGNESVAVAPRFLGTPGFAIASALFVRSARQKPEIESFPRCRVVGSVEQAEDRTDTRLQPIKARCDENAKNRQMKGQKVFAQRNKILCVTR